MLQIVRALTLLLLAPALASATVDGPHPAAAELNVAKAAVLGVVEGVTEYLPVSSTGHLLVAQELMGVGTSPETEDAAETYAITIQGGAILAVLLLYFGRVRQIAAGAMGRDPAGRRVLLALAAAFVPAAVIGLAFEEPIRDRLYSPGPIAAAWAVGGVVILVEARWLRAHRPTTTALEHVSVRTGLLIGLAQVFALWPGTSRSLVTILAALALGLGMVAALEFSFLLGLVTLTAATTYQAITNGGDVVNTFGLLEPLIGFAVAFLAAIVAVRWLVAYLSRHGLELFGWYRIGIAGLTVVLLATGVL